LQGVAYHDDKQVTALEARKYYADVDGPAFADVSVEAAASILDLEVTA
jgi:hypothetical protein